MASTAKPIPPREGVERFVNIGPKIRGDRGEIHTQIK